MIKFGTAGCPEGFYQKGCKSTMEVPKLLNQIGLDAFEVQCGRGVRFSDESARHLGHNARQYGVTLSVHAPYYINIATTELDKRENSFRYIMESARFASLIGANRVIVHMGALMGKTRVEALSVSKAFIRDCLKRLDGEGLDDIHLCPETMGKINQMGTVSEVVELCTIDERLIPTLDFGHINAREQGCLKSSSDYDTIFDEVESKLGSGRLKRFHAHFSKIEYTKGGERRHLTFEDHVFGPEFEPLAEVLMKRKLEPIIICESAGTQDVDAVYMKGCCYP